MELVEVFAQSLGIDQQTLYECCENMVGKFEGLEKIHRVQRFIAKEFQRIIDDLFEQCSKKGKELKDYQTRAILHLVRNHGLLVGFKMGSGKTITAIVAAELCRRLAAFLGKIIKVIFVSPVSLIPNFKKEIRSIGLDETDYEFYSMDKFAIKLNEGSLTCKNAMVVIDEIHNFRQDFRGIFGGNSTKVGSYSRGESLIGCGGWAWKMMGLSGTPVYNLPHDIINLVAALKGQEPMTQHDFETLQRKENTFKEYMSCMATFHEPSVEGYPKREDVVDICLMSNEYLAFYNDVYEKTRRRFIPKEEVDDEEMKNSFMVKLRQAVNAPSPSALEHFFKKGAGVEAFPKVQKGLELIKSRRGPILVYSEFKEKGIELFIREIAKYLERDIDFFKIDGETSSAERKNIVLKFNKAALALKKPILFVTKAGGEGLDLKGIRDVIIFESGWNASREEQVIARAVRYLSHEHLPENERKVTVHHLVSISKEAIGDIHSIMKGNSLRITKDTNVSYTRYVDIYLKVYSHRKLLANEDLISRMKELSIETLGDACKTVPKPRDLHSVFERHTAQRFRQSERKWLFQTVASLVLEERNKYYTVPATANSFDNLKEVERIPPRSIPVIAQDMPLVLKAVCLAIDVTNDENFTFISNSNSLKVWILPKQGKEKFTLSNVLKYYAALEGPGMVSFVP